MSRRISPQLGRRLAILTGADARGYCEDLRGTASAIAGQASFAALLRRHAALGDEKRLLAVALLKEKDEMCACELEAALQVSGATVNHHMEQLLAAGLVASDRRGKWTYYRLTADGIAAFPSLTTR